MSTTPHSFCPFSRIPVVKKKAWMIVRQRLVEGPLQFSKKMNLVHEIKIPTITTLCHYFPSSTSMITWSTAANHGRLFVITVDMCTKCYGRDIRVNVQEGFNICAGCGLVCGVSHTNEHSSYQQSYSLMANSSRTKQIVPRTYSNSSYKRCNQFKEYLLRVQGRERNSVTAHDLENIKKEIFKRGLFSDELDPQIIRSILKSLGLQKHYNHIYFILKQITGHALVDLSQNHTQRLYLMFVKIQKVFGEVVEFRANIISYYYILRKLCELLCWDDIAKCLPHLKSQDKVLRQDQIWKKICLSLGYPFIRSTL